MASPQFLCLYFICPNVTDFEKQEERDSVIIFENQSSIIITLPNGWTILQRVLAKISSISRLVLYLVFSILTFIIARFLFDQKTAWFPYSKMKHIKLKKPYKVQKRYIKEFQSLDSQDDDSHSLSKVTKIRFIIFAPIMAFISIVILIKMTQTGWSPFDLKTPKFYYSLIGDNVLWLETTVILPNGEIQQCSSINWGKQSSSFENITQIGNRNLFVPPTFEKTFSIYFGIQFTTINYNWFHFFQILLFKSLSAIVIQLLENQ
ncbi:hypothetical protein ACTA71_006134 [Dictyostelium dimigraforme]